MKRKSPVTVQQWVESLPINQFQNGKNSNNTPNQLFYTPNSPQKRNSRLTRDFSLQSDSTGSHCSSVECVLELRRPDPEEVLIGLGFGPSNRSSPKSRIPERFLQPSKVIFQRNFTVIIFICSNYFIAVATNRH